MRSLAASSHGPAIAFTLCAVIWGSTWLAIKVGYEGLGAFTAAALRFGLAAVLLAVVMLALRLPLPRERKVWRAVVVMAVLLFLGDYGLIYWGEQGLDSGLTAVLFATFPLLTAGVGHLFFGERLTTRKLGGILLGMLGLAVVFADSLVFDPSRLPWMLAVVGAAMAAAISNQVVHRDTHGVHPASYTMPGMALGAVLLEGAALAVGEPAALPTTGLAWLSVLYLAAFGSVVAFLAYFWLQQAWGATRAAVNILVTPIIALVLGTVLLAEDPGPSAVLGTALVLAGIAVTLRAPRAAPAPPLGPPAADPVAPDA